MSLIPWRGKSRDLDAVESISGGALGQFRAEMDRLFDRCFGDMWDFTRGALGQPGSWLPSLDVSETDKEVTIRVEVPGVDPKDIQLAVTGQTLSISGEKREQTETKSESCFHSERRFGSFKRTVPLPSSIDPERTTAEHKNGVLMVRLAKRESAMPKRIEVKAIKD